MKGSDIIIKLFELYGISVVFGYPGACILDIYDSLQKSAVEHILTVTEQGAVSAADGYARISGKLGVVLATSGPGASNLITGIAAANLDGTPLLAVTGNVPTDSLGTDSFQEVDIAGMTMPVTKYSKIVTDAENLARDVANAIKIAVSGRKGAVLLDIPQDIQQADISVSLDELADIINFDVTPLRYDNSAVIEKAAERINNSDKTALLVGGGIRHSRAEDELYALATKLNCPVITTLMGVSLYDNKLDNYFGLTGVYGNPAANHALKTADTIISLGVRFNDRLRSGNQLGGKTLIQFDIDDAENGKTIETEYYVRGDLKDTLPLLTAKVTERPFRFIQSLRTYALKTGKGDNNRRMRNSLKIIADVLSPDDVTATDVGSHQMAAAKNYCMGKRFLTNGGLGAMGWGLGAVNGAMIYEKQQKSTSKGILITGDGSFNMEMQELCTTVAYDLPIIIIIFNNKSLEMCRCVQEKRFGYEYMSRPILNVNYKDVCRGMNCDAVICSDTAQLKRALNGYKKLPFVIDYRI